MNATTGPRIVRLAITSLLALALAVGTVATASVASATEAEPAALDPSVQDVVTEVDAASIMARLKQDQVLHVALAHSKGDYLWYAQRASNERGFEWVGLSYEMACSSGTLRFNPWLNVYDCMLTPDDGQFFDAESTKSCVESTGQPWKQGARRSDGTVGCFDSALKPSTGVPGHAHGKIADCAPWESFETRTDGISGCLPQTYDWVNDVSKSTRPMNVAPDACTGQPADLNRTGSGYVALSGRADACTGADAAPDCPEGSEVRACLIGHRFVPRERVYTRSATAVESVTVTESVASTKGQSAKRVARVVERRAARYFKRNRHVGVGRHRIYRQAYEERTRTRDASYTDQAAATKSCEAPTAAGAQTCAAEAAQKAAREQARERASAEAQSRAKVQADQAAWEAAGRAAARAARNATIPAWLHRRAVKSANYRANVVLRRNLVRSGAYIRWATAKRTRSWTATRSDTHTANARLHRETVTSTVSQAVDGETLVGTGQSAIFKSGRAEESRGARVRVHRTRKVTRWCHRAVAWRAKRCARHVAGNRAAGKAVRAARQDSISIATSRAERRARNAAVASAREVARAKVITAEERATHQERADARAQADLDRQLAERAGG